MMEVNFCAVSIYPNEQSYENGLCYDLRRFFVELCRILCGENVANCAHFLLKMINMSV